jgi:hypothetical protein
VTGSARVNVYAIVSRAVEEGVAYGWMRAHKHTDSPDAEMTKDAIVTAVTGSLCEVLDFDQSADDDPDPPG